MSYEDEIYHSGYLDGYYASMELYHSDEEMSDEERRARRKKRRRNIALGIGGAAVLGAGGYAVGRALRRRGKLEAKPTRTVHTTHSEYDPTADYSRGSATYRVKPKRKVAGFRKTAGTYKVPNTTHAWIHNPWTIPRDSKIKPKRTIPGFIRNPGTYRFDPNKDFGGFLTLQEMHRKARQKPYKNN